MSDNKLGNSNIKKDDKFLERNIRELIERNKRLSGSESPSNLIVVDSLDSISRESALSANQGRILNERMNSLSTINVVKEW